MAGPLTPVWKAPGVRPFNLAHTLCSLAILLGCDCSQVVSVGKDQCPPFPVAGTAQTPSESGGFLSPWPTRTKGKPWVLQGREESWRKPQGQEGTGHRTEEPVF